MVKLLVTEIYEDFSCFVENQEIAKRKGAQYQDVEWVEWAEKFYLSGHEPEKPEDMRKKEEINALKDELAATDYRIIKCSEYNLAGQTLPYDIDELHARRQALRDRINELEN